MKKKLVGMLILAMTATTILGGCGSKEGKEETSDGKVKIRFLGYCRGCRASAKTGGSV